MFFVLVDEVGGQFVTAGGCEAVVVALDHDLLAGDWFAETPGIYVNLHRQIDAVRTIPLLGTLEIDHYSQPQYGAGLDWFVTILAFPMVPRMPALTWGDLGLDLSIAFSYPMSFAQRGPTAVKATVSQPIPNRPSLIGQALWYQTLFFGSTPTLTIQSKLSNVTRTVLQ